MIALILTSGLLGLSEKRVLISFWEIGNLNEASASTTDGTIDSTDKYAWSENLGWINFGTAEGNVHITDSVLTGYAWSENTGWISLNCSNNSSCATVDHKVANDGAGNLSGYAWSENTGWINFNPSGGGVSVNSSGEFLGYAWGENIGWIVFNCATTNSCATVDYKVKTDWRLQTVRPQCNNSLDDDGDGKTDYPNDPGCSSLDDDDETDPGGGMPSEAYNPPMGDFGVLINNGDENTNNQIVTLKLYAGSDTKRMAISNTEDFEYASIIPYQGEIEWELSSGKNEAVPRFYGTNTVYVKFYTQYGVASEVVSAIIISKDPESEEGPIPNGSLIKVENDYKVYIKKGNYLRHIPSPAIFSLYGHFKWDDIRVITKEQFNQQYQVSTLIRELNDTRVYQINDNNLTKHHLNITAEQFTNSGRSWEMVYVINKRERDYYEMGKDVEE